jgi:uncharacterized cupin superfamily protein
VPEARLEDSGSGLEPAGAGWFVVHGVRLHVLEPGEPNGLYHSESQQEAVLVLSGKCRLPVEDEERLLRPWDFFHSPA